MTFSQLLYILRARIRLIALITLLFAVASIAAVLHLPKKYKATNTVIFNYKVSDPISGAVMPAQLLPGYMATEVDIITSKAVLIRAIDSLALYKKPDIIEDFNADADTNDDGVGEGDINDWIYDQLVKNSIVVTPSRRSNLIYISARADTAEEAANIANAVSDAYLDQSVEFKIAPSRTAAKYYTEQLAEMKEKVELANKKYSDFQYENNIQAVSEKDIDVETARLNDLSQQLVVVQGQLAESRSRRSAARRGGSPDVTADTVVQIQKNNLATAKANFARVASQFGVNHPEYIAAKTQVDQARASLNRQIGSVSRSVSGSARIFAQSEAEIKAALEKQRSKVLKLNQSRNELRLLERDLAAAQRAFNAANDRFIKSNFEGESNQSNVTLLSKATPPRKHYSPKKRLVVIAATLLGGALGVFFVLLSELFDRRIRSVEDLEVLLDYPVFGVLPKTELKQIAFEPVKSLT